HRDVKPANILVRDTGELVLSDFGIAVIAHNTSSQHTTGMTGTWYYVAPEQIEGKPRVASDQYSLGAIVYEWLCGTTPFTGSSIELVNKHMKEFPKPMHEHVSGISSGVENV